MGRFSRAKGRRGELRACKELGALGFRCRRVSGDEAGAKGSDVVHDVEAAAPGEASWSVQCKEAGARVPSLAKIMENATLGFVHLTAGKLRGKSFVIVAVDDLRVFARDVYAAWRNAPPMERE